MSPFHDLGRRDGVAVPAARVGRAATRGAPPDSGRLADSEANLPSVPVSSGFLRPAWPFRRLLRISAIFRPLPAGVKAAKEFAPLSWGERPSQGRRQKELR